MAVSVHSRRALLSAGLAGGAAAVLAACDSDDHDPAPAAGSPSASGSLALDFDPQDWDSVRDQFNLDPSRPSSRRSSSRRTPRCSTPPSRATATGSAPIPSDPLRVVDLEQAVRTAAAQYAGGQPGQYALTDSTTMGIATMYGGLRLTPGDEVVTTAHDFYSTEDALRLLAERSGATVTQVTLHDDPATATVDDIVGRLAAAVTPRTKVVAVTWVHSSAGVRLPLQEICTALAD